MVYFLNFGKNEFSQTIFEPLIENSAFTDLTAECSPSNAPNNSPVPIIFPGLISFALMLFNNARGVLSVSYLNSSNSES